MRGRERALTALAGGKTDRVARYCDLRHPALIRELGGVETGPAPYVRAARALGIDMTRELARPEEGFPPETGAAREIEKTLRHSREAFQRGSDEVGEDLLVLLEFPQAILGNVMARHGAMDTLTALAASPTEAADLLEEATGTCLALAEGIAAWGEVPAVLFMDDLAGNRGPLISPETLRALYFPRLREVVEILTGAGIKTLFHSDGDLSMVSRDILATGVAGLHPVEPVGKWSLEKAASDHKDIILVGNAPLGKLGMSREAAEAERTRCLAFASSHAAYFMAPAAEIGPEVPLDHLLAFFAD
ncbi:MAG: uroporphyrinogen decarboxylase family protein [Planctomycetota bacterium]|jgi:uroporphyrinogen-III decarboxylase